MQHFLQLSITMPRSRPRQNRMPSRSLHSHKVFRDEPTDDEQRTEKRKKQLQKKLETNQTTIDKDRAQMSTAEDTNKSDN